MDNQRNSPLNWAYFYQGKSMEELRHSLLLTTLELETTRLAAQEEIRRRDEELIRLKDFVSRVVREKEDAQNCQRLLMEKLLFLQHQQQQTTPLSGISSIEDEHRRGGDSNTGVSSSDCEESIVSSPVMDPTPPPPQLAPPFPSPPPPPLQMAATSTPQSAPEKQLPEKGKFLQAVMKAGPLLQTLLLAGPLPQWRHPPPQLDSLEIPPVAIPSPPPPQLSQLLQQDTSININSNNSCGGINKKKRGLMVCEGSDSSTNTTKFQRVVLH